MKPNKIDQLLELLQQGVEKITTSKEYRQYLKTMSRFPVYSIRNTILIHTQKPDATMVAGFQTWQNVFGRHVRKGEKGIRILAPYTYTVEIQEGSTMRKETRTGFKAAYVFDISQTEGRDLPSFPESHLLQGSFRLFHAAIPVMEKLTGFIVHIDNLEDGTLGLTEYGNKVIFIHSGLEESHAFKTLIHECAHALLHHFEHPEPGSLEEYLQQNRELREIEAESVSFVVCSALGLDSSDYSFAYVAMWKGEEKFLEKSLERIARTARILIDAIEKDTSSLPPASDPTSIAIPDPAFVHSASQAISKPDSGCQPAGDSQSFKSARTKPESKKAVKKNGISKKQAPKKNQSQHGTIHSTASILDLFDPFPESPLPSKESSMTLEESPVPLKESSTSSKETSSSSEQLTLF